MYALDAFEELIKLKDDPEAFAKRRDEILNEAIAKCPNEKQSKLHQQCWCINKQLNKYKNPISRMNKMAEIFWQGVYTFEDTLRNGSIKTEPRTKATVIPFKKK